MMGRLRESRWVYVLLSIFLAIVFWMYVRLLVDPQESTSIHNVRVELLGENVLTNQGLTVAGLSSETVTLRVEAPSSVLNNLLQYRENIYVTLDVSRCAEGENSLSYKPVWPTNFNVSEVTLRGQEPANITVTVEKLYTRSFDVEFELNGKVAQGYQMGTPAIEPASVVVSGPAEQVNQVDRVVAILNQEELSERFAGDLPLTALDSLGNPITDLEISLSAESAYVVVPVVVVREVPLEVEIVPGGGATEENAKVEIDPLTITISGSEADVQDITKITLRRIDLATVVGTNTFQIPISLDPSLENVSGETTATVTVTVEGLDTALFDVDNITLSSAPDGYTAVAVTQVKTVTVRGKAEDLAQVDASQIRIVADLSDVTAEGQFTVPARVYLDASSSVGVIGEYTIVVRVSR